MKNSFTGDLRKLRNISNLFDEESKKQKQILLKKLSQTKLPIGKSLEEYQNLLLFLAAHSSDHSFEQLVRMEMSRLSLNLKKASARSKSKLENTGLPFTVTNASLTHDMWCLLLAKKEIEVKYYSSEEENIELNDILSFTLPDIEKDHTAAGFSQEELMETLQVKEKDKMTFLINELKKLNHVPFIKDYLLDKFNLYADIVPNEASFSKLYNRLKGTTTYFHSDILKKFDHLSLVNSPLPVPKNLSDEMKSNIIEVMQTALVLLQRETDPCTFIDPASLRFYELERGISVAIFGMIPERQMSMESYVGYTLFKNGYPCAYGGGWVYGTRSLFGINVFEQFRGGESGFVLMQLLRTYKQVFNLRYFEVEPYQYGLDNPEGIESGAFWFYYRYGFRPLDKTLNKLSHAEAEKIKSKKGYRSSSKTLIRFTESNIGWQMEEKPSAPVTDLRKKTTTFIHKKYQGDRQLAIETSLKSLRGKISIPENFSKFELNTLKDFALITECMNIQSPDILELVPLLAKNKSTDLYQYNQLLTEFLKSI